MLTIPSLAQLQTGQVADVMGLAIAEQLQKQALAMVEKRAILKPSQKYLPLPQASVELYFDIEAEPERNLDYLLGVIVVDRHQGTEQFHGFLAQNPEEEAEIWQAFLELVRQYPHAPIYHFSEY